MASVNLVDMLRAQAERRPDQVAFRYLERGEDESAAVTYADLDAQARSLAAELSRTYSPGERVALVFTPGIAFVTALVGTLYAGLIPVPASPPGRGSASTSLCGILADSEPVLVLTDVPDAVAPLAGAASAVVEAWAAPAARPADGEWISPPVGGDAMALLQYTSGSVGSPCGVMVTHRNLMEATERVRRLFGLDERSVVVSWLPHFHDMALVGCLLGSLHAGGTAVLMSPLAFMRRPMRWLEAITRYRATASAGPDFAYRLCADRARGDEVERLDLRTWNVACNGGEPVRVETMQRFAAAFRPAGFDPGAFSPSYGLAEATLVVCSARPGLAARVRNGRVSCGSPEAGEVVVVDPSGRPVVDGTVGEIWVRGAPIAAGYSRRDPETEATFGAHLRGGHSGLPYLRTGDLGVLDGGELFVTGRLNDVIVVRGRNHYPQDIEATVAACDPALSAHRTAAFLAGDRLVVVLGIRRTPTTPDLAGQIRRVVALEHGVLVADVVIVPAGTVPVTTSGKVQRAACRHAYESGALRPLLGDGRDPSADRDDQSTRVHPVAALRELVAATLGIDPDELDEARPFSHHGLDSLTALQLQHQIYEMFGTEVHVARLLDDLTLNDTATLIEAAAPESLPPPPDEAGPELSDGQRALWFLSGWRPDVNPYRIARAFHLPPDVDVDALRQAVAVLFRRHRVLRSRFPLVGGEIVCNVGDPPSDALPVAHTAGGVEELAAAVRREAEARFDLETGPVARFTVFEGGDGTRVLLVAVHHIVVDLWSMAVLAQELGILYTAFRMGVCVTLPPPAAEHDDAVRWQRRLLDSETGAELARRWRERLSGELPELQLPATRPRPAVRSFRGSAAAFELDGPTTIAVDQLAREASTTGFVVLLSAYVAFLRRLTGQREVVVGVPCSGRASPRFRNVVGCLVNTLPMRIRVDPGASFEELLRQVRGIVVDVLADQDYPLARLVEEANPDRSASRSPLFEAMFTLVADDSPSADGIVGVALDRAGTRLDVAALALRAFPLPGDLALADLDVVLGQVVGRYRGRLVCSIDVFEPEAASELASLFAGFVGALVTSPGGRVRHVPLLDGAAQRALLDAVNGPEPDVTLACIHEVFAASAAEHAEAVAVSWDTGAWTFADLDREASAVASALDRLDLV